MAIRLTVYLVKPALLIAFITATPMEPRLCGELPPRVASVKLKRRLGWFLCATITLWMRLLITLWLWPASMSKSTPSILLERYVWMNLSNPLSVPQVNEPAAPQRDRGGARAHPAPGGV